MSVSARWSAGIACAVVTHHRPGAKRVYLRLSLDEARQLERELREVIAEREPDTLSPHSKEAP